MKLNEKIIQARKRAGMSQIDLADALGVSRQSVSKWETGESNPDIGKLPLLAQTLKVSIDWLLSEDDPLPDKTLLEHETRCETPSRAYPEWVEHLPNWLGRFIKRFGWLFGVYVAVGGFIFALFGVLMNVVSHYFIGEMSQSEKAFSDGIFQGGDMFNTTYQQTTDRMYSTAQNMFSMLSLVPIVIGIVMIIIGIILAVKLKKWSKKEVQSQYEG